MEKKSNGGLIALVIILGLLVCGLGGYIAYDKMGNNQNVLDNSPKSDENKVLYDDNINNADKVMIRNSEVKEIFNIVEASVKTNNVCVGYYYQKPFANHTLENKVNILLYSSLDLNKKQVDSAFKNSLPASEKENADSYYYYVKGSEIRNALKKIFNLDVQDFDSSKHYGYKYIKEVDSFVSLAGGGNYPPIVKDIIAYKETNDTVEVTEVKAELQDEDTTRYDDNGNQVSVSKGVYRYLNKFNTLVSGESVDNFKFTRDNVNKFEQIKYIFKKNNEGKYYLKDIVNLNYENDYAICQ